MSRLVAGLVAAAACQPPGAATTTTRPGSPADQYALLDLVGGWRWLHRADESGTSRVEEELWRLRPAGSGPARLVGRYARSVEVRSRDGVPFSCNQRPWYRQRAVFDVEVVAERDRFVARETGYLAEPSPCDHGFRRVASYAVAPRGNRMTLSWGEGEQTLWQIDRDVEDLSAPGWSDADAPVGPWRWQASSFDDAGDLRDEAEWWEVTRRGEAALDATYRRRVTVRSRDGAVIACAGAPSWSFDDAYVLRGEREEEHWHLYEIAVEPGDHPCLRASPRRVVDEATAEQLGDFLVLEWRGKRRQVLHRPDERR